MNPAPRSALSCVLFTALTVATPSCSHDDGPSTTTSVTSATAASSDPTPDDLGGGEPEDLECTYPNPVTICGCGNACGEDSGLCKECGWQGEGCGLDEIVCCSDVHCPAGTQCTTLSDHITEWGFHFCYALDPCDKDSDCVIGEVCRLGYCRDDVG